MSAADFLVEIFSNASKLITVVSQMKKILSLERLTRLRDLLKVRKLQGYILATEDEHFNEYVGVADRRCEFISGFTGSSCSIIVTLDKAALWTDGRYQLQGTNELDDNWSLFRNDLIESPTKAKWIVSSTPPGSSIGYDGRQIPYTSIETLKKELINSEAELGILSNCNEVENSLNRQLIDIPNTNLIDLVWDSMSKLQIENIYHPIRESNPLLFIPISFSGLSWQEKIDLVRKRMEIKGVQLLVLSALDEIAWLFNLRGSDILYNPVFYAYALISFNNIDLFLYPKTVCQTPELENYLHDEQYPVMIHSYVDFFNYLEMTVQNSESFQSLHRVWLDLTASYAIVSRIPTNLRLLDISPIAEMKSIKSLSELNGIREIHITDSLVLCDFLAWLEGEANRMNSTSIQSHLCEPIKPNRENGAGLPVIKPPNILTEASTAQYLDALRSQAKDFFSLSFSTISCSDANGAIIHYHPVEGQDAPITNKSIYLVDSGGQYLTGTTDVTRTIHLNEPTLEEKNCYTAVLKAHISLSMQIFPSNTPGSRLDVLSRRIMWQYRGNYAHGTGHGVGAFLNVHEGPIGLSGSRLNMYSRMGITEPGLQENMVVTIEPGYYWTDHFGIRLENVVFIVPVETVDFDFNNMNTNNTLMTMHNSFQFASDNTDCTKWLTFEPVTLVPFQRKFININMLSMNELNWLNNYHNIIRKVLCQRIYQEVNINLSIDNENLDQQSILSNMSMLSSSRQRCLQWIINQTEILS
ncbi:Xaa-Pro aminopeptidase 1 [Schistosoma japonicum]|uniref:Xaa-Pro aminopeptidase 1 n=2 Tax=Schistosoma japonicum TaxID=6182 RepID=A0A4Z2CZW0_SCHJA|nr:Xaa-Pro aminopeptidase 1 [Schistosoma japonicum]